MLTLEVPQYSNVFKDILWPIFPSSIWLVRYSICGLVWPKYSYFLLTELDKIRNLTTITFFSEPVILWEVFAGRCISYVDSMEWRRWVNSYIGGIKFRSLYSLVSNYDSRVIKNNAVILFKLYFLLLGWVDGSKFCELIPLLLGVLRYFCVYEDLVEGRLKIFVRHIQNGLNLICLFYWLCEFNGKKTIKKRLLRTNM